MINQKTIFAIIILFLLAGNVFLCVKYFAAQKELGQIQIALESQKTNEKVLDFTKFFVKEVLKRETEIDFETRLRLENDVRNLNDEEILTQWKKFTESKDENESQIEVKNLLEMLVNRIRSVK